MGRENRREYNDDPERTTGDWRSGGRDAASDRDGDGGGRGYRGGGDRGNRGFDRSEREGIDNEHWRDGDRPRMAFRDNRRDDDRGGGGGGERDWNRFANRGPNRDIDRDDHRGDRDDRGGGGRSGFGPRRFGGDSDRGGDRDRDNNERRWVDRGPRTNPLPSSDDGESGEPRTRPKLNLKPRTKPIEPIQPSEAAEGEEGGEEPRPEKKEDQEDRRPKPTPVPAANIFGTAKPVDTAAKEREIEERLKRDREGDRARGKEGEAERDNSKKPVWGRRNGVSLKKNLKNP